MQSPMRASVQAVDTPLTAAPDHDDDHDHDHDQARAIGDLGATRVMDGFDRIQGQRIVLGPDHAQCTVFGRRHRHTIERQVPLSVALGLARRGVATVVRVGEA